MGSSPPPSPLPRSFLLPSLSAAHIIFHLFIKREEEEPLVTRLGPLAINQRGGGRGRRGERGGGHRNAHLSVQARKFSALSPPSPSLSHTHEPKPPTLVGGESSPSFSCLPSSPSSWRWNWPRHKREKGGGLICNFYIEATFLPD